MFRYALLISTIAALPVAAQPYNGGSLITTGDSLSGVVHTVSPTSGNAAGPVVRDAGVAVNQQVGNTLLGSGSDIAPIDHLTTSLGNVVNRVAGHVTDAGTAINAQGLEGTPVIGSTVHQIATGTDSTLNPLLSVIVVDRQVSGSPSGAQLLSASVLSSSLATGAPLSASVLSGGQVLSLNGTSIPGGVGAGGAGGLLGGLLGPVSGLGGGLTGGGASGGLLSGVTSTVSSLTGGLTSGGAAGGAGGLLSGVTGIVSGLTGSGLTGGLGSGSTAGGVGGLVSGVTGTVTNLTGGLAGGSGGAGGLLGGVTSTVSSLTGGLGGGTSGTSGGGLLGGLLAPVSGLTGH
jgi:hypothetical protein